jgi:hypothetical protein
MSKLPTAESGWSAAAPPVRGACGVPIRNPADAVDNPRSGGARAAVARNALEPFPE